MYYVSRHQLAKLLLRFRAPVVRSILELTHRRTDEYVLTLAVSQAPKHTLAYRVRLLWALCVVALTLAVVFQRFLPLRAVKQAVYSTMVAVNTSASLPKTPVQWRQALEELPARPGNIPAFFFGHGSPMLAFPESDLEGDDPLMNFLGPKGPLASFLKDFGPALLNKYKPKAIVVFSAHWETEDERLGMSRA